MPCTPQGVVELPVALQNTLTAVSHAIKQDLARDPAQFELTNAFRSLTEARFWLDLTLTARQQENAARAEQREREPTPEARLDAQVDAAMRKINSAVETFSERMEESSKKLMQRAGLGEAVNAQGVPQSPPETD